nr:MAG TPA: hypothetical protein [Caudoviricetes sp.]
MQGYKEMRGQAHPPKNQDTRKSRRNAALFY